MQALSEKVNSWFETPRFPVGTEQRITKRTIEKGKYVLWLVHKARALSRC
jgi:hypothetical protein